MLHTLTFIFAVLNFICFVVSAYRFVDKFDSVTGLLAGILVLMNLAVALMPGYAL